MQESKKYCSNSGGMDMIFQNRFAMAKYLLSKSKNLTDKYRNEQRKIKGYSDDFKQSRHGTKMQN